VGISLHCDTQQISQENKFFSPLAGPVGISFFFLAILIQYHMRLFFSPFLVFMLVKALEQGTPKVHAQLRTFLK
jgi:hypothetical protein